MADGAIDGDALLRNVVRWLLRRGSLYVLLVLALAIGPLVVHAIFGGSIRSELMSPREVAAEFERRRDDAVAAFESTKDKVATYPASTIKFRLIQARADLTRVGDELEKRQGWLASIRPRTILERKELELRETALKGEIRLLEAAGDIHAIRTELESVMAPTEGSIAAAKGSCDAANSEARGFNARHALDRSVRNLLTAEARRRTDEAARRCAEYRTRVDKRTAALERIRRLRVQLAGAQAGYANAGADAQDAISRIRINLSRTIQSVLGQAALLLAGIIATPYLIRLVFYFLLAPLAERRPAVRLRWPADAMPAPSSLSQASATSAPIKLDAGQELVVRQGFLQSTSSAGAKATRALLDWHHPMSSLASGLAFLTRIEGEGETTTVSATRDPFAEVAVLNLPQGAACVLQPRAVVAVVQPVRQPIRITSHWRLGSLHAWLTLQLRYLIFHGPARLVIKGSRGVRVEQVERGRVFGQDQLVGFSADLAYSVTRTETFWPYFLGMEQLLKDKVEAGKGVLIVEEAPMAGGVHSHSRKGLEGAADVLLKAVGL